MADSAVVGWAVVMTAVVGTSVEMSAARGTARVAASGLVAPALERLTAASDGLAPLAPPLRLAPPRRSTFVLLETDKTAGSISGAAAAMTSLAPAGMRSPKREVT